ncbi:MAG TPA: 3-hydroxyacyl-CoA dehydrogenase NAD-binding domain-containing protein [Vicinamibacterales bacterium]|nr:3-hydroxyacyl-CoA dehydrogenase NAD-binding domain-containing protein [Vicinamibacterales bacterium]
MSSPIHYEVTDRVAVLTIDNPPVNALSPAVWQGVDQAVARAGVDEGVGAIVIRGAGTTFVAGADIKIFDAIRTREQSLTRSAGTHALLRRLEDSSKPLVAAIHGNALGGGNELAMACHFRVATGDARIGQPEVMLGIIPGAGGTQRLPRLCGPELALRMCTDGKPISAQQALAQGIIDRIIEGDLTEAAVAFAREQASSGQSRRTRERADAIAELARGLAACQATRASLPAHGGGSAAARAVVDAIEAGLQRGFDAGSERERELFAGCVISTESKALRHLFFAEREVARVPGVSKETPAKTIVSAAVLGAGTMGGGIAMTYANAGIPVLLKDVDQAAVDRGLSTIRANYQSSVARGRMTPDALDRTMRLITPTTNYDRFDTVDIVVEAVFEDMELKKTTFAELGRVTKPECVLATNSSTLDVDEFARASGRPEAVIGHHFFSPANVMKLLEIVRGRETSPDTIATSIRLAKRLGKIGVVVGNCFGFVANRMLAYYMRESYLLCEEGASVAEIDQALTDFGMPVGPFGMQDIAGIDVGARIRQYLRSIGKTRAEGPQSELPDRLYAIGRYGQKTGAGWYRYEPGSRTRISDPLVDQLAEEAAARRGIARRRISSDEILARITTALANEGARVLEEGYAIRASDIDVIYCYGFGFPRYRGGPMFYADTIGLPEVLARVNDYRSRFGDYWQPAPLLERLVATGRGFYAESEVAAG